MKPNEKQSTIGTHEAVVYGPMIDWKIKKQAFITSGTCATPWWCHALDMFEIGLNIQQGWRHHADLPLPGVQNSHPALSKR